MCKAYHHKLKFENYVLFSGIVEMILLILFRTLGYNVFQLNIQFLQILITMFVSRRFLKLYFVIQKKTLTTHVYNIYWYILLGLNISLNLVAMITTLFYWINKAKAANEEKKKEIGIDEYFIFAHSCFSFIVSTILLFFSLSIQKIIKISLEDSKKKDYLKAKSTRESIDAQEVHDPEAFLKKNLEENFSQQQNSQECEKEIYLKSRQLQLWIIVSANISTDTIEFVINILKLFVWEGAFDFTEKTTSNSIKGFILLLIEELCLMLSTICNYLAFYFIVRNSYQSSIHQKTDEDIIIDNVMEVENSSVRKFLDD